MDRKCPGCGKEYWAKQRWMHERCATNTATNGEVIATNSVATEVPRKDIWAVRFIKKKKRRSTAEAGKPTTPTKETT